MKFVQISFLLKKSPPGVKSIILQSLDPPHMLVSPKKFRENLLWEEKCHLNLEKCTNFGCLQYACTQGVFRNKCAGRSISDMLKI